MKIDSCLILSAGLGTRMGPIGKILPKPLWPLFEKKILELQINFVLSLGIEKIYVNGHHCHAQLKEFIDLYNQKSAKKIVYLYESTLLGSGGGVHNVANLENYKGALLYLAVDQFNFFDRSYFDLAKNLISSHGAVLFGLDVDKSDIYNRLIIENNLMKGIEGPHSSSQVTFSGMGLINLEKLRAHPGVSSFFDTVANFNEQPIYIITPKNSDYWDFGTSENYLRSCFRLLEEKEGRFLEFCKKEGVFAPRQIHQSSNSYGPFGSKNLINLSKKRVENPEEKKAIVLGIQKDLLEIKFPGLFLNEISEKVLC
jgi:NDP-sugar pyrophosphorylase family protein